MSPDLALACWTENEQKRQAGWLAAQYGPAPRRILIGDDTLNADAAYRLASQGTAILWRGDFHNGRQLLQAMARRFDARRNDAHKAKRTPRNTADVRSASLSAADIFNQHRLRQSQRAQILNRLLIELVDTPSAQHDTTLSLDLRRAPDVGQACEAAIGPVAGPLLLPLRALQGYIGAYEWLRKGVAVPGLPGRIHVSYGVFSPNRGEYLDLVQQA